VGPALLAVPVIAGFAFKKGWQEPVPLRLMINEEAFLSEAKKGSW
jgi:sialidase-1